jgi:hypothetical protein
MSFVKEVGGEAEEGAKGGGPSKGPAGGAGAG